MNIQWPNGRGAYMSVKLVAINGDINSSATEFPEVVAASYARISRSKEPIEKLREIAQKDVERARLSNENIVYGMGHASIAEHVYFNIDITNISRVCLAELEKHRMASYTEKSQRYVNVAKSGYYIPSTVDANEYCAFVNMCMETYQKLIDAGVEKEDARYILPQSIYGQVGFTVNARSLEHIICCLAASPFEECKNLSNDLLNESRKICPSLIKYIEPSPFLKKNEYRQTCGTMPAFYYEPEEYKRYKFGFIKDETSYDTDDLDYYICSLLTNSYKKKELTKSQMYSIFMDYISDDKFDPIPRELEHIFFTHEIICTACCYDQLKRHRIQNFSIYPYSLEYGFSCPSYPVDINIEQILCASKTFLLNTTPEDAQYFMLMGNKRRVISSMNLRELTHFWRLRLSEHAQLDIRLLAEEIYSNVLRKAPIFMEVLRRKHG